jgi:hypothetical protein
LGNSSLLLLVAKFGPVTVVSAAVARSVRAEKLCWKMHDFTRPAKPVARPK